MSDSSININSESRFYRSWKTYLSFAFFLSLIIIAAFYFQTQYLYDVFLGYFGVFVLYMLKEYWNLIKRGKPFILKNNIEELKEILDIQSENNIKKTKSIDVIQCPVNGNEWQDVVELLLPYVDSVIVEENDLQKHLTKNLQWEINLALNVLGASKIVLLRDNLDSKMELILPEMLKSVISQLPDKLGLQFSSESMRITSIDIAKAINS